MPPGHFTVMHIPVPFITPFALTPNWLIKINHRDSRQFKISIFTGYYSNIIFIVKAVIFYGINSIWLSSVSSTMFDIFFMLSNRRWMTRVQLFKSTLEIQHFRVCNCGCYCQITNRFVSSWMCWINTILSKHRLDFWIWFEMNHN